MPITSSAPSDPAIATPLRARLSLLGGVAAVAAGVLLQVPDVLRMVRGERSMGMAGGAAHARVMMSGSTMAAGMLLSVAGVVLAAWAVFASAPRPPRTALHPVRESIQQERVRPVYVLTCAVLTIALVIDVMKPLTVGFVLPGLRQEYGLSLATVSALPVVALTGTAVGSIMWGLLGDRYGRRPVLLLAALIFIATSACGAMPAFQWNLVMCFLMGASAGGLLPLVFTLVAELTPAPHRGWIAVTIGSVGGLGGYLAASNAARFLEPDYTWRMLWLIGLPSGLALLAMSPLIPESPTFLLRSGQRARAEAILRRYGSRFVACEVEEISVAGPGGLADVAALLRRYPAATCQIMVLGVIWGVVNFGFMLLLPAQLRSAGMTGGTAGSLLANSVLYSAPALIGVVLLYAGWNARSALALFMALMSLSLAGVGYWTATHGGTWLATASIGMLVVSLTAVNATLLPYSAGIYPTAVRATGTGLAAGATKLGGVFGPFLMLLLIRFDGSHSVVPALVLACASAATAALLLRSGPRVDSAFRPGEPASAGGD